MKLLLIGAGNMGGALLSRWAQIHDVTVVETNSKQARLLEESHRCRAIAGEADVTGAIVILAVKPQAIESVRARGKAEAIVSIMAGIELSVIKERFSADRYARAMPNLAALYGKSATALCGDESFKGEALELFGAAGSAVWLESEKELAIATALSSAVGFLALGAEALANGATRLGMKTADAHKLTASLFEGVGELLKHEHPALLKERVTSAGGTTAAGLAALEREGARHAFYEAIRAAFERSNELALAAKCL
ncbi:MAG: pyrroline-5-carboxylate reductase [Helicobacteraceae bacterium]|nr:pyrroline-5-carboxylate reductase [Helicobacteraceae bacterium]